MAKFFTPLFKLLLRSGCWKPTWIIPLGPATPTCSLKTEAPPSNLNYKLTFSGRLGLGYNQKDHLTICDRGKKCSIVNNAT